MKPIFGVLGVNGYDERCKEFTEQYYKIILCGTPFYMFASSMASIIRASGAPRFFNDFNNSRSYYKFNF